MRTLPELQREASGCARFRGHSLVWKQYSDTLATGNCSNPNCTAGVTVNLKPMPNEIDIGGDAVAVGCPVTE
jgi:hypothetical protein